MPQLEAENRQGSSRSSRAFSLEVHLAPDDLQTFASDVAAGLAAPSKRLPSKYFYDDRGSALFDRLGATPEYYPTRTEHALLEASAAEIVRTTRPSIIVELGSGAARKTGFLLEAAFHQNLRPTYIPFDVSEGMLRESSERLLAAYPWLQIHGIVGDFERHLDKIPEAPSRLFLFLGGTIGNFTPDETRRFLAGLARQMGPDDRLLLGTDLVKAPAILHAAYNDAAGITAAFNRNLLAVINRRLGADFEPLRFEHVAFYEATARQIEMHLRAAAPMEVTIPALGRRFSFRRDETIRTEISRKFVRGDLERLYAEAGLALERWFAPPNGWFGLSIARPAS